MKKYNFGSKISDRIYAILLKIVNRKNAGLDVTLAGCGIIIPQCSIGLPNKIVCVAETSEDLILRAYSHIQKPHL